MHRLITSCFKHALPNYVIVENTWLHTVTVSRFPQGVPLRHRPPKFGLVNATTAVIFMGSFVFCWEAFCPFGKMSNSCPSKWTGNVFTGRSTFCVKIQAWFFCVFIFPLFIIASCPEAEHSYDVLSRTHPYTVRGTLIMGFWYNITTNLLET